MSGIATAIVGGAVISGAVSAYGASKASGAAESAAATQAGAEREQLEYLKEVEAIPQAYREQALQQLGMLYGLPGVPPAAQQQVPGAAQQQVPGAAPTVQPTQVGGVAPIDPSRMDPGRDYGYQPPSSFASLQGSLMGADQYTGISGQVVGQAVPQTQQIPPTGDMVPQEGGFAPQGKAAFVQGLTQDPFYQGMLDVGEEAVLRGAAATGGLRSGSASEALARNNQAILRGLYGEQVAGLQGLAGLPSNVNQIGNVMGGIGATQAAGQVAAGQAWQQGLQGVSGAIGSGVGNYMWAQGRGLI